MRTSAKIWQLQSHDSMTLLLKNGLRTSSS
jgi:hypothetical protein